MDDRRRVSSALALCMAATLSAQRPTLSQVPAPIERRVPADPDLDAASNLIGQALIMRCFCAEDSLSFNSAGQPDARSAAKRVDWTLAGIDIQKVLRRTPGELEINGVRVALKFAPDRREFERHPQKTETMHLMVAEPPQADPVAFRRTLRAIFS